MKKVDQVLTPSQEDRCSVRLNNDVSALEEAASERMKVVVSRFGSLVRDGSETISQYFHRDPYSSASTAQREQQ